MNARTISATVAIALLSAAILRAETLEEVNAKLSAIGAEQIDLGDETKDAREALDRKLRKGSLDTPEMKEIRRQIEILRRSLKSAEDELQAAFEAIPEVKSAMDELSTKTSRQKALQQERARLLKLREQLMKAKDEAPKAEAKGE